MICHDDSDANVSQSAQTGAGLAGHVLIVDDEKGLRELYAMIAHELGFTVSQAGDKNQALKCYAERKPTAILLDLTMPGGDGVEILRDLAQAECDAPINLVSGQDQRVLATAERLGKSLGLLMRDSLQKPVSLDVLEAALQQTRSQQGLRERRERFQLPPRPQWLSVARLQEALDKHEFTVYLQPKVKLQGPVDRAVCGCEALVRWQHPEHGLVPPGSFIPFAEESGLIGAMTERLFDFVISMQTQWLAQGMHCPIALNLSPLQLTDLSLPDRFARAIDASAVDPSLLSFEVTEQAAMSDIEKATEILTRLRLKGFSVSLDDFGAGYSSLAELYRLPLSEIKLDRSLIVDLDSDRDARVVVRALSALAEKLGIPVCAEGIETDPQLRFLRSIGCATGQGYLFAEPMPSERFIEFLNNAEDSTSRQLSSA